MNTGYMEDLERKNCASFFSRLLAYVIDIIPISFVVYILYGLVGSKSNYSDYTDIYQRSYQLILYKNNLGYSAFFLWILYSAIMDSSPLQGTFGKYLMGLRVTCND